MPHVVSYVLCYLWEKYSQWSKGQLPPAFNRRRWYADWKKTRYSNEKLKTQVRLGAKGVHGGGIAPLFPELHAG